jgi:hypothetical protein
MTRDEFETLLGSLAAQYTEACGTEMAALVVEGETERTLKSNESRLLWHAYDAGLISGKNAEQRKAQASEVLFGSDHHRHCITLHAAAVIARKEATMTRVGIEYEIKLWRAWLASQGGDAS